MLRGGCGRCPYTRFIVAASVRGGGEGWASAVEAGRSCSRHQGRHFLWGERETREIKIRLMIRSKENVQVYLSSIYLS